ncbi:hypothetical protein ACVBEQ_10905 [Nakamurella sp. GG22]
MQFDRIRRRKWVVAAFVLLFLVGGLVSALTQRTTYTTKAALLATSQNRAPEQDAILAQGYVNFFNDPSYQATLRKIADVPDGVTFKAETVASSPLIYVVASSSNEDDVRLAASKMATAFYETVNKAIRAAQDRIIAGIRQPFDDIKAANGEIPDQALVQLEDRISAISANSTNQLEVIQLESSVTSTAASSASAVTTLGLAVFGGVVVGCAIAIAMAALNRRVGSEFDLADKTGLPVTVVIPHGDPALRVQRYGQLANAVARADLPTPSVLAVTPVGKSVTASQVAWAVGQHRADQGVRTLMLDAGPLMSGPDSGLTANLRPPEAIDLNGVIRPSDRHAGLLEFNPGGEAAVTRATGIEQFERMFLKLQEYADLVVVIAPPIVETAECQALCAASDAALLVVEQSVTRISEVQEAKGLIEEIRGRVVGAVLLEKGAETAEVSALADGNDGDLQAGDLGTATKLRLGSEADVRAQAGRHQARGVGLRKPSRLRHAQRALPAAEAAVPEVQAGAGPKQNLSSVDLDRWEAVTAPGADLNASLQPPSGRSLEGRR